MANIEHATVNTLLRRPELVIEVSGGWVHSVTVASSLQPFLQHLIVDWDTDAAEAGTAIPVVANVEGENFSAVVVEVNVRTPNGSPVDDIVEEYHAAP